MLVLLIACTQQSTDTSDSHAEESEPVLWVPTEEGPYDAGLYSFSFSTPQDVIVCRCMVSCAARRGGESCAI